MQLINYQQDARAIQTDHALTVFVTTTEKDFKEDPALWDNWLERHGDNLVPVPWQDVSEPVRAWKEAILIDLIHGQSNFALQEPKEAVV